MTKPKEINEKIKTIRKLSKVIVYKINIYSFAYFFKNQNKKVRKKTTFAIYIFLNVRE